MNQLIRYETARNALAECQRVDEVKDIRDKAEAMAAYARQAKDQELIMWATEIKVRAERKCGELLQQSALTGERATSAKHSKNMPSWSNDSTSPKTLAEIGITKDQSSRYQQLAAMPDVHFETAVATAKDAAGEVTTAFMLREANKNKPKGRPMTGPKADAIREELKAAKQRGTSIISSYARLILTAIKEQEEFSTEERDLLSQVASAINQLQLIS